MKKALVYFTLLISLTAQGQSLYDYLQMAAENNPRLKSKYKLYLASLEKVEQQGALPDPILSFGYFISPVETRVGAQNMRFSLSQMLPWMGTRAIRKQAAASWAKVKFEEFQEEKSRLFFSVQTQWLRLYELDAEIQIQGENLKILESYEPITKTKYEANLVSLADLVRAQIQIEEAQTEIELFELKREIALNEFNALLKRSKDAQVKTSGLMLEQINAIPIDSIKATKPELIAAKERINALNYQLELSRLARKPNIGFGLDYAIVSKREGGNIEDNGKDIFMPMVNFSLPIFKRKNLSRENETKYQIESAELILEQLALDTSTELNSLELDEAHTTKQLELFNKEIEKTELLLRVLTSEYSNNNSNFEELLSIQQKLLKLQLSQSKAKIRLEEIGYNKIYLSGQNL